jgi:TPR repeat protein
VEPYPEEIWVGVGNKMQLRPSGMLVQYCDRLGKDALKHVSEIIPVYTNVHQWHHNRVGVRPQYRKRPASRGSVMVPWRTILAAAFIFAPIAASALADNFEDALDAYQRAEYATAFKLWRPLADKGDARAQSSLGSMYISGRGVTQDYAKAARWYRKAADQGDVEAQNNLGVLFYNGQGVSKDYIQAYKWFDIVASTGNEQAGGNRDIVAKRMTPDQITVAQKLAREWNPKK